jgi:RNA polymerase sigma-70 factor (ECF subfamily)
MTAGVDPPWEELRAGLRAFISRRVRNQSDVDDLVQRVLLRLVKGLESLRDAERLHAWMYRTARNVLVDYYRATGARRETAGGDAGDLASLEGPEGRETADERAGARELAGCLAPMLRGLSPEYREAVTLADVDGVTQAEAARRAGVSLSGMKSRVQRGRRQLRAALEACCRVDLDRRGGIAGYDPAKTAGCGSCGGPRS